MKEISYNDLVQVFGKTLAKSIQNVKVPVFIGENIQHEDKSYKVDGYFLLLNNLRTEYVVTSKYGIRLVGQSDFVKQPHTFLHIEYDHYLPKRTETEIIDDIEFRPAPTDVLRISLVRFHKVVASHIINNVTEPNFDTLKSYIYDAVAKHKDVARRAKNEESVEER